MRAVIWFTLVLSTQTYPPCELTPQTSARVGCSRIPEMPGPTVMRATGRSLTRSTTAMLPSAVLTYAFRRSPGRKKEARCSRKSKIAAPSSSTVVSEMTRAFRKRPFTTPVGQALRELILFSLSVDLPMQHCGNLPHLFGQFGKFLGQDRLHAVGESLVRLVVDFHQQSIRANGNGCARERQDFVAFAGSVAGVNQNRQVAAFFHCRHDGQIQRVARMIREGAHAALAQHHVVISFGEHVLGGHQEFIERGAPSPKSSAPARPIPENCTGKCAACTRRRETAALRSLPRVPQWPAPALRSPPRTAPRPELFFLRRRLHPRKAWKSARRCLLPWRRGSPACRAC